MNEKVLAIINEILEDNGNPPLNVVDVNTSLRNDIGFNSIDLAVLTAKIEEEYGVDIFANGIIDTMGEILENLE